MRIALRNALLVGGLALAGLLALASDLYRVHLEMQVDALACSGSDSDCESRPDHHHGIE